LNLHERWCDDAKHRHCTSLLLLPHWALIPAHVPEALRGRIVSLVFAFTAIGHFVKTPEMTQMLPPWVPMRAPLIYSPEFSNCSARSPFSFLLSALHRIALCIFLL
jgi:hypothetical protein